MTIIYTIPSTIPRTIPEISNNIQNDYFQNMTQIVPTIKINQNNLSYCSMDEVINNTCTKGKMDLNDIDNIKDYLKNNIGEREDGLYKKIKTGNVVIQFATVEEQKNANDLDTSSIDLGEDCENKIRNTNNIDPNKELIVYKVDVKNSDLTSTYVNLEVYDPDDMSSPLDLSICEKIVINTPVNIGSEMEEIYNSLNNEGYNLFNNEDSFYQDICTSYTRCLELI